MVYSFKLAKRSDAAAFVMAHFGCPFQHFASIGNNRYESTSLKTLPKLCYAKRPYDWYDPFVYAYAFVT
jgi:hypothetical protein